MTRTYILRYSSEIPTGIGFLRGIRIGRQLKFRKTMYRYFRYQDAAWKWIYCPRSSCLFNVHLKFIPGLIPGRQVPTYIPSCIMYHDDVSSSQWPFWQDLSVLYKPEYVAPHPQSQISFSTTSKIVPGFEHVE